LLQRVIADNAGTGNEPRPAASIVIPLYNEQNIIEENVAQLGPFFDRMLGKGNWAFIFVDNGSTDRTAEFVKAVIDRYPPSRYVFLQEPNYGAALKAGLRAATTKWVYLIDIEQWDLPFVNWAWSVRNSYDIMLASKRADPTLNFQQPYRRLLSAGLNVTLQVLFSFSGTDTHGPKLINRESMAEIIANCELDRGQFDTELVLKAMRGCNRLVEVPVVYRENRPQRNWMIKKIAWNILALRRLRTVMRDVPFAGNLRYYRFARDDVAAVPQIVADAALEAARV
jgi:glycosyltransferase involved in cell wall biosynthesis